LEAWLLLWLAIRVERVRVSLVHQQAYVRFVVFGVAARVPARLTPLDEAESHNAQHLAHEHQPRLKPGMREGMDISSKLSSIGNSVVLHFLRDSIQGSSREHSNHQNYSP
jgi:hypothetical protein